MLDALEPVLHQVADRYEGHQLAAVEHRQVADSPQGHHLERIAKNAERLELLVRDVLAYSRVAQADIQLEPVDLGKLLENLTPTIPELHRPGVTLEVRGATD